MNKTWGDIFKDRTMVIALVIMFQFFGLILIFAFYKTNMVDQAKNIILQTYVIAFTAAWGYFIGSSVAPPVEHKPPTEPSGANIELPK
jgi:hypothetical protein